MKGDKEVLKLLNDVLTAELTAINQYFIHAKMCGNWGYAKLAEIKRSEALGEMKDADAIIERILFLEGVPNVQKLNPVRVGEDAVEQHENDLAVEREAVKRLNKAIAACASRGDNGTRELLERILEGEEKAADFLEAQLHIIDEIGKEAYLAEHIRD